ncbi:MAG: poly(A) polymerase, partial [Solirubrobacterales bacterium]|nr:poly(A) polymerase [Solirubrobacterales bacterium]
MSPAIADRLAAAKAVAAAREAIGDADAWIVGGAVRDAALGLEVADLDLAVPEGEEAKAARAIARTGDAHVFQISDRFNTWRAIARDGSWQADVSALRGGTIDADLAERDFTLTAAAVPLAGGEPIDPFNGLADLERSLLRAVSETSFSDDPLRLMRAA